MSSGFTFGAKPAEPSGFGQTPAFGGSQFGAPSSTTAALPQFGTTFGAKTTAGFQFSSPAATAAPNPAPSFGAPSFNFNTTAAQSTLKPPATTLGFGTSAPSGGFPFGGPITTTAPPLFGTATASQAPNLFGTVATSAPSAGTGLTFGTPKPTAAGASFAFNAPAPTTAGTGLSFATPASTAPGTGLTFGTPASTGAIGTGLAFGTPALSVPAAAPPPNAGLTFNASSVATPIAPFGAAAPTVTAPGVCYGTTVPTTGLTFGPPVPVTGLTFGTSTPSTGLSFGAPTQSAGLTFGTAAPTTQLAPPSTGLTFSTGTSLAPSTTKLSFGTPLAPSIAATAPQSSAPATSLTFGTPAASTQSQLFAAPVPPATSATIPSFTPSTTSTTLNFLPSALSGTTAAATTAATSFSQGLGSIAATTSEGLSFGLGGTSLLKPSTSVAPLSFGALPTTTASGTPQRTVGLGGVSATPPKPTTTTSTTTTGQAEIAPRDQVLPNELLQTVEHFKKFLQEQKCFSSEIARFSMKDLKRVETDIELVNNHMNEMQNELQKNKATADTLQLHTANDLQNVEMAQRTFDTPAGLQYENTAPFNYFLELSHNFEKEMHNLKVRIENIDRHVRNTGPTTALNSQDLSLGMRRLHETFVALAGRLQSLHNQVEFQKEQYLNIRKQVLNDYTNVFETPSKELECLEVALESIAHQPPAVSIGPTPFSSLGNSHAQVVAQNPPPAYPATTPMGTTLSSGFNPSGQSSGLLFGSSIGNTSSLFNTSSSTAFQLQKPPVGNKRGKP